MINKFDIMYPSMVDLTLNQITYLSFNLGPIA